MKELKRLQALKKDEPSIVALAAEYASTMEPEVVKKEEEEQSESQKQS
jgi:hypothetical protein